MQKITPCLWFDKEGEEAANFYCSLFKDSRITAVHRYPEAAIGEPGSVMLVEFELAGQAYQALNGGPVFKFTEAVSMSVDCESQEEVDRLWDALTADGGEESMCGWLKDKYGLAWQIVPRRVMELMRDPDKEKTQRAFAAMMQMRKLDVAMLEKAAAGG